MSGLPLLSILIAVPLVAGALCLFLSASGARWAALIATLIDFVLSLYLWQNYDASGAQWQFVERIALSGSISWALGIDGIALTLIALT
ncbi:MAG: NADH-quinone oxidoreductase subunit M, partial [Sphingomicrobium sp.]